MSEENLLVNSSDHVGEHVLEAPPTPKDGPGIVSVSRQPLPTQTTPFDTLLTTWQATGIRVGIPLPYVGDDRTPLFYIRHTPIIPHMAFPFPGSIPFTWRNLPIVPYTTKNVGSRVRVYQHSPPPFITAYALSHRRWAGSIAFRLNAVTNFTASGYVWCAKLRNAQISMLNDPTWYLTHASSNDGVPSSIMSNSFMRSDVSMFRHIEVESPYEYPVPWMDTMFDFQESLFPSSDGTWNNATRYNNSALPCNADYLAVGLRGQIAASDTSNMLYYEVEMRLMPDFQFAQPLLPFAGYCLSPAVINWQFSGSSLLDKMQLADWPFLFTAGNHFGLFDVFPINFREAEENKEQTFMEAFSRLNCCSTTPSAPPPYSPNV